MHNTNTTFWHRNGLSIVVLLFMTGAWVGQILTGHAVYNDELSRSGALQLSLLQYLASGHFVSATFENWESEFLQMGMYVLLSVSLRQKGSAESWPMDPTKEEDRVEGGLHLGLCAQGAFGWRSTSTPWPLLLGYCSCCPSRFTWTEVGGMKASCAS